MVSPHLGDERACNEASPPLSHLLHTQPRLTPSQYRPLVFRGLDSPCCRGSLDQCFAGRLSISSIYSPGKGENPEWEGSLARNLPPGFCVFPL